ncbi:hypothetical protein CDAR_524901 [Caerostris darwini]|uniref:Uncharacterized protein n=1 Tax=Caerostris darwini TaxID=1538125 RepID=A0AAV4R0S9_9ARAC|nr:hypothetical protein CDAR_524901 [Caerostris darwini]
MDISNIWCLAFIPTPSKTLDSDFLPLPGSRFRSRRQVRCAKQNNNPSPFMRIVRLPTPPETTKSNNLGCRRTCATGFMGRFRNTSIRSPSGGLYNSLS